MIARETGALLQLDAGLIARFDEGLGEALGWWTRDGRPLVVALSLGGAGALAEVNRSGGPARVEDYVRFPDDPLARIVRAGGYVASVAVPVRVGRRLWGALLASSQRAGAIAPDAEARLGRLAELVAVAIGNVEAREQRQAVQLMKDEFVSVVSHELRTPLTSIRGSLGLLAAGVLGAEPERAQRMLEIALTNTDRLVRLINDILDIERMESGRIAIERRPVDAGELMRQAADAMRGMADDAGVAIEVAPLLAAVLADPDRVQQMLANLLSNAIKFSPPGATVGVEAAREGGEVRISVRDRGRGIPADKLSGIFERFGQIDSSDARDKGGTGLGLAICRTIAQQHEGRLWVDSEPGAGSTFHFTLPIASGPPSAPEPAPARAEPRRARILVGDDDAARRDATAVVLERRGFVVVRAPGGVAALARADEERPDALVLGLGTADLSGWEVAAALAERGDVTPVVILSPGASPRAGTLPPGVVGSLETRPDDRTLAITLERALARRAPGRVLVVEDDADLAEVLTASLERHGVEVLSAASGTHAVALARARPPDLILLDVALPSGDGFWVTDALRAHPLLARVPILVYTALDLDESGRRRLDLGRTRFASKRSVTPEEIERRVLELMDGLTGGCARAASDA